MRKAEKAEIIANVQDRFMKAKIAVLTDYRGLNVEKITDLRAKLRVAKADYKVVKNTLAGKAAVGTSVEKLKDHFSGPIGIVLSYDDSFGVLKILTDFAKTEDQFKIKAGVVEDRLTDFKEIRILADLPSKDVLLGKFLAGAKTPLYGLAGSLNAVIQKVVFALNAVQELKAKAG